MRRENDMWYRRIVRDARYNDRCRGRRIDATVPFISTERLLELQKKQENKCCYCNVNMEHHERRANPKGLTLERADNSLPHYITNCHLCCKSCNSKRYSTEESLLRRYFNKWKAVLDVSVITTGNRVASFVQ